MIASRMGPVRDAYRQGAAQGYRDASPPPDPGDPGRGADALASGAARAEAPSWAQRLARRQRLTQAGLVAAGALREGDRPASGGGPDLKDKS
jgi:type IV secretory pathway TrbL component